MWEEVYYVSLGTIFLTVIYRAKNCGHIYVQVVDDKNRSTNKILNITCVLLEGENIDEAI